MRELQSFLLGSILLLPVVSVRAFYLPGAAPHNFEQGEQVNLYVNALTPMLTGKDDSKLVSNLDSCGECHVEATFSPIEICDQLCVHLEATPLPISC